MGTSGEVDFLTVARKFAHVFHTIGLYAVSTSKSNQLKLAGTSFCSEWTLNVLAVKVLTNARTT
jgi:hypothetical protein